MPFDGAGFPPREWNQPPPRPNDNAVSIIIIALAVSLLVMPISLTALIDVVRYLRSN